MPFIGPVVSPASFKRVKRFGTQVGPISDQRVFNLIHLGWPTNDQSHRCELTLGSLISRSLFRIVKGLYGSFVKRFGAASIDLIISSGDLPGEFFFFHLADVPLSLNASGLGMVVFFQTVV